MNVSVQELMRQTGVAFGTSGARGLASALTDFVCYVYAQGFLQYLKATGEIPPRDAQLAVAGDLRPSTERLLEAVGRAAEDLGCHALNCGRIPSPALALFALSRRIPAIMVTGSHIPADRNGLKFNKCSGEILKPDEQSIRGQVVTVDDGLFDSSGAFSNVKRENRSIHAEARRAYITRYLDFFPHDSLTGLRVGVYQHSAVGRELLVEILTALGAAVVPLGFSEEFIPVDTEAIRPEDRRLAREWTRQERFDAIVSTDGDSDRPLVSDERGEWLRGDVAGILCARYLEADTVCLPVSCNTAVDRCGLFGEVQRTRIGSPYVIEAMLEAGRRGRQRVVGYEANGGFLIHSPLEVGGKMLLPLPTRDALIVVLSLLRLSRRERKPLSQLVNALPARHTASDRLQNFSPPRSQAILARFATGDEEDDRRALEAIWGPECGPVARLDRTDGLRVTFANDEIVHLRPSGNAPEFRCYTEAASPARASALCALSLSRVSQIAK